MPLQILPKLPRLDRTGKSISSDLGSYSLLKCRTTTPSGGGSPTVSCSFNDPFDKSMHPDALGSSGAPGTVLQYAEGPALYGILAFVMAALSVLFTTCFICGRYFLCCCPRTSCCCITLQCGGHEPTRRLCCCGVIPKKDVPPPSEAIASAATAAGSPSASKKTKAQTARATPSIHLDRFGQPLPFPPQEYPKWERRLTLLLMLLFWAFTCSFMIIGAILGFTDLPKGAAQAAPTLTAAYMPIVTAAYSRIGDLVIRLAGGVLAPSALAFNRVRCRLCAQSRESGF